MGLNLRSKIATPVQTAVTLFADRAGKVTKKAEIEKEITDQNGKLTQQLQAIFKPIAAKSNIGFNLTIKDESVEVSTEFNIVRANNKKPKLLGGFRMTLTTIPIRVWLEDSLQFNLYLSLIDKNIRLLNRITKQSRTDGKLTFTNPNQVTIGIDTRNRYFS